MISSFFFTSYQLNHLSTLSAIPPDSTYFLEIVNKSRRFTVSAMLHRRRRWSYGNETLISHALQSATLCIILAAAAGSPCLSSTSLSLFLSHASVFFRLASILGNLEVRRLLLRRVALLNANAPVNYEGGPTCSDCAFLNARAEEVREMSAREEGYRKAARLLIS